MKRIILYIIIAVIWSSCSKEELPPVLENGEPVFNVDLTLDNTAYSFSGSDYLLQTSYSNTVDGIVRLSGRLVDTDCSLECGPSLELHFYDVIERDAEEFNIDEVLVEGSYDLVDNNSTTLFSDSISAQITFDPNDTDSWCWLSDVLPIVCNEAELELNINTIGSLSLEVAYPGVEFNFVTILDGFFMGFLLEPEICVSKLGDLSLLTLNNVPDDIEIQWLTENDSMMISTGRELMLPTFNEITTLLLSLSRPNFEPLYLVEIILIPQEFNENICSSGPMVSFVPGTPAEGVVLGRAEIVYIDEQGDRYVSLSEYESQSIGEIRIANIEDFELNARGEKTKKFNVTGDALLLNDRNEAIEMRDINGVFGVAYPD